MQDSVWGKDTDSGSVVYDSVEIGQLLVVVTVASMFAALRSRSEWAGRQLVYTGSIVVIVAGAFWFVQRVFFPGGV